MSTKNEEMKKYELQDMTTGAINGNSTTNLVSDQKTSFTKKDIIYSQFVVFLALVLGIAGGILIGIYGFGSTNEPCEVGGNGSVTKIINPENRGNEFPTATTYPCASCSGKNPIDATPSKDSFLFAPLTVDEMKSAYYFLQNKGLVVPKNEKITRYTNYVTAMFLFPPNKQQAIQYLDHNGANPGRFAQVLVARGGVNPPDVMEYKVGPLNKPDAMTVQPLLRPGEINYESRPMDYPEIWGLDEVVKETFKTLQQLVLESFDGASYENDDLSLVYTHGGYGKSVNNRETRVFFAFNGFKPHSATDFMDLVPLSFVIHNPGRNSSQWRSHDIFYLNQGPYDSAADLMTAYRSNTIRKIKFPTGHRQNLLKDLFPERNRSLPIRENSQYSPPRTYQPSGPRYTVQDHAVKWMGWEFAIGNNQHRGPSLHNIKFKGNRIVYELANNDISLTYASGSSSRTNSMYMDAVFGIGYAGRVIKGVDCPEHATVLDTHIWRTTKREGTTKPSICVFEADGEEPLWRHREYSYQAGLRNHYLVVRMPCLIGNYDYLIEWRFMLNGELHTYVTATGFLQTSFWDADDTSGGSGRPNTPFGFRVTEYATGDIHDHSFGMKVDFDVVDSQNSLDIIHWKAGDVRDALKTWRVPPYFPYNSTRFIEYETLQSEAGMKIDLQNPKFWTFVNEKYRNKWGNKRGYRLIPLTDVAQVLPSSYPSLSAMAYTKYHCTVTKRKEEEQYLTSLYDSTRFDEPIGSLDNMLDGENIVNEDLVAWVTVGFLHVPSSEDVPMTTRLTTGFALRPFNFFDTTATFDVQQYLESKEGEQRERPPKFESCAEPKYGE